MYTVGKALCMLTKADFCNRAPAVGDLLFNTLYQHAMDLSKLV